MLSHLAIASIQRIIMSCLRLFFSITRQIIVVKRETKRIFKLCLYDFNKQCNIIALSFFLLWYQLPLFMKIYNNTCINLVGKLVNNNSISASLINLFCVFSSCARIMTSDKKKTQRKINNNKKTPKNPQITPPPKKTPKKPQPKTVMQAIKCILNTVYTSDQASFLIKFCPTKDPASMYTEKHS